jgi:hypothetical protein
MAIIGLKQKTIGITGVIIVFALLMAPVLSGAKEIVLPTAYTAKELAKVREWEKTWVGKKIDKSNIDQVAEFMPESYVGIYKDPEKWGGPAEGYYFYILPYKKYVPTKGMLEAIKKYSPLVKTNPDGTIANYEEIAGFPFPNPKTGWEIACNFEFNTHGDTAHYRRHSPNINPKARTDRVSDQEYWEFFWIHRTEVEPMPKIPKNRKGLHKGYFTHMRLPAEFINTRMYRLRYIAFDKTDDSYLWYSQFRRIRRLSTSQFTDAIDGTDLIYDDEYLWDGKIIRNTYTYKGKKELLCTRHMDMKKTTRQLGQGIMNGLELERCNTLVVDAVSKDPNYIYGKRVWYVDPESYVILWTEIYDELDRFWKCFMNNTCPLPTKQGQEKMFIVGTQFENFQRTHSGGSHQQYFWEPEISDPRFKSDIFTISNLQRTY